VSIPSCSVPALASRSRFVARRMRGWSSTRSAVKRSALTRTRPWTYLMRMAQLRPRSRLLTLTMTMVGDCCSSSTGALRAARLDVSIRSWRWAEAVDPMTRQPSSTKRRSPQHFGEFGPFGTLRALANGFWWQVQPEAWEPRMSRSFSPRRSPGIYPLTSTRSRVRCSSDGASADYCLVLTFRGLVGTSFSTSKAEVRREPRHTPSRRLIMHRRARSTSLRSDPRHLRTAPASSRPSTGGDVCPTTLTHTECTNCWRRTKRSP
jgi:hypothetical protein